ncbi:MAG TPA: hypothetical protein VNX21_04245 [Candidatus Thermoplasmatota archaeon]|nr:hypothetical protein [Candidatus Thermoplasmatota archaeon]
MDADERDVEATLDLLESWGLVEERDGHVHPTRRWNARLQAAAEKLNVLAAQTGVNPQGNPLVLAVRQALAAENLTDNEAVFQRAARVLLVLELTRMTPEKRAQMGFGNVRL